MPKSNGGLWKRKSRTGNEFLSGIIEIDGQKHKFVAFENSYKNQGDSRPDWVIKINEEQKNSQYDDEVPF